MSAVQLDDHFVSLINQNQGIARKVCGIYFQNSDDYEDVLQEMMYQLWKSYPGFDGRSKFSTWMYRVCLNTALTYRRKSKASRTVPLSLSHNQIADTHASTKDEEIAVLFDTISTLSSLNRAVILLYLEDMSYEEIANITGLSKTNVSVRLVRIKKELETKMKLKS